MRKNVFPKGWDEARVKRIIAHYENQTDEQAAAEDDEIFGSREETVITIPRKLVPQVKKLIAAYQKAKPKTRKPRRVA